MKYMIIALLVAPLLSACAHRIAWYTRMEKSQTDYTLAQSDICVWPRTCVK